MKSIISLSLIVCLAISAQVAASESLAKKSSITIGEQLLLNNNYEEAEKFFLAMLESGNSEQQSLKYLSRICLQTKRYDDAVEFAEQALANKPEGLEELILMGDVYCAKAQQASIFSALGLGRKCIANYNEAASKYPESSQALLLASEIYLTAPSMLGGSEEKGQQYFDLLMEKHPEYAKTYQVGLLQKEGKRKAANTLASVLAEQPFNSAKNQYKIAHHFKKQQMFNKAKPLFEQLIQTELTLENKWYVNNSLLQLGQIYIAENKNINAGIELIERYKQRNSNRHDSHYYWSTWSLASGYKAVGNEEKYQQLIEQIKSEDYENNEGFAKFFEKQI